MIGGSGGEQAYRLTIWLRPCFTSVRRVFTMLRKSIIDKILKGMVKQELWHP